LEGAGAQSQVAQLATAAVVAVVLLFLTRADPIPSPLCARRPGLRHRYPADQRANDPGPAPAKAQGSSALALIAVVVVVAAGVEQGIVLAMILSLLRIVHHSYHPATRG